MLGFIYNIIEVIVRLVVRIWRPQLEADVTFIELTSDTSCVDDDRFYYFCKFTITNKSRDALYTDKISLTINEEKVYRIRNGADRVRIDPRQPLQHELSFPVGEDDDAIDTGRFCIEIKPTSGKSAKVHGMFPIDLNPSQY